MQKKEYRIEVGGEPLVIMFPGLAEQTWGEAWVQYGGTVLSAVATMNKNPRPGGDFFPLTVEFEEKYYAAGTIRGSRFLKREARPTDEAILSARLCDRTIRPRFPKGLRNEVQVVLTTLSFDHENDPDVLGIVAGSLALGVSAIPWDGPVGAVRIGLVNEALVINPTYEERQGSSLDLIVAGTKNRINMLEGRAKEVPEEVFLKAVDVAFAEVQRIIELQEKIFRERGQEKFVPKLFLPNESFRKELVDRFGARLEKALFSAATKTERVGALGALREEIALYFTESKGQETVPDALMLVEDEIDRIVHEKLLKENKRPDGRAPDELRHIACEVGILPRVHGSALFVRGTTKALSVLTLGAPSLAQLVETMEGEYKKPFMHHYNFPAYSVGEIAPFRGPGRREIGHGMLAEKALEAIVPDQEKFPYTIRTVSEILSSNGSTSMASVCASSLAMMDGGVPIARPAAGIAIGLMSDGKENWKVLTDIQGPEDHHGDMDLKIAGTSEGITALQMDVKIEGITKEILAQAVSQGKNARLEILAKMNEALSSPRPELSQFAPRVVIIEIKPEKIREVIGPGGSVINAIIKETGADIDIEDSGRVFITAKTEEGARAAVERVKSLTQEAEVGAKFSGTVTRTLPFGVMVEVLPRQEGLVHVSELGADQGIRLDEVFRPGETLNVFVREIDSLGRINLALEPEERERVAEKLSAAPKDRFAGPPPRFHDRGPRRSSGPRRYGR